MNNKIAIIGEARVGKSRISSEFCENKGLIISKFTGSGADCTEINIVYEVRKNYKEKGIIRFESIGSTLNGLQYDFTEENVDKFMKQIKEDNKYSGTDNLKPLAPANDCIKIVTTASAWACGIMGSAIDKLTIIDTPGVSGNVEGLNGIENAQIYMFVMRPTNEKYFKETVSKMAPTIGGSSVIYIYNLNSAVEDESDIEDLREKGKKGISDFVEDLFLLRGEKSVIDSSIELLNPEGTVVPMGSFRLDAKENFAEKCFKSELEDVLIKKLKNEDLETLEIFINKALLDSVNKKSSYDKDALIEYIKQTTTLFEGFNKVSNSETAINNFLSRTHDRVKTKDNYAVRLAVSENLKKLLRELYNCYSKLSANNKNISKIAQAMQETIIKYCYKKLALAVKNDCGLAEGNHPFEEFPPITMWAEESVIADEILKAFSTSSYRTRMYVNTMKKAGFTSSTWEYVAVNNNASTLKLEIIKHCKLNELKSSNDVEVIYNAYNLALLKLGQYSIFEFVISTLGLNDNPINWI